MLPNRMERPLIEGRVEINDHHIVLLVPPDKRLSDPLFQLLVDLIERAEVPERNPGALKLAPPTMGKVTMHLVESDKMISADDRVVGKILIPQRPVGGDLDEVFRV